MLSKKYYRGFAEMLGKSENLGQFEQTLIAYLKSDNSRFSEQKFRDAIVKTKMEKVIAQ